MKRQKRTWEEIANKEPDLHWCDLAKASELERQIWRPEATLLQRAMLVIIAILLFSGAVMFLYIAWDDVRPAGDRPTFILLYLVAVPCVIVGCRLVRNALLRPPGQTPDQHHSS